MFSGTGIYSIREAARLIQVPPRKLGRWMFGHNYSSKTTGAQLFSSALWTPQPVAVTAPNRLIGFADLLEARFVSAFASYGVPLRVIRHCLASAQNLYRVKYPFTTLRFKTDGKTIFAEAVREASANASLVDLNSLQNVFREIIRPSLYAGIEYRGGNALKWYPALRREGIVLDPARESGRAIIEDTGTPTDVLYASYVAEGATPRAACRTARIYDVPLRYVRSAIKFESHLSALNH